MLNPELIVLSGIGRPDQRCAARRRARDGLRRLPSPGDARPDRHALAHGAVRRASSGAAMVAVEGLFEPAMPQGLGDVGQPAAHPVFAGAAAKLRASGQIGSEQRATPGKVRPRRRRNGGYASSRSPALVLTASARRLPDAWRCLPDDIAEARARAVPCRGRAAHRWRATGRASSLAASSATFGDCDVAVIDVVDCGFAPEAQIAALDRLRGERPDAIISMPVANAAVAAAHARVSAAGIRAGAPRQRADRPAAGPRLRGAGVGGRTRAGDASPPALLAEHLPSAPRLACWATTPISSPPTNAKSRSRNGCG